MAVLDTSFLIDLMREKKEAVQLIDELEEFETALFIPAPCVMELWSGAMLAKASVEEKGKVNQLLASFEVLAIGAREAKEAGEIEANLIMRGLEIQPEDVMIAGIARLHGEKLVTADGDYSRIPNLKVLKY